MPRFWGTSYTTATNKKELKKQNKKQAQLAKSVEHKLHDGYQSIKKEQQTQLAHELSKVVALVHLFPKYIYYRSNKRSWHTNSQKSLPQYIYFPGTFFISLVHLPCANSKCKRRNLLRFLFYFPSPFTKRRTVLRMYPPPHTSMRRRIHSQYSALSTTLY
jgi:hypothetical protein